MEELNNIISAASDIGSKPRLSQPRDDSPLTHEERSEGRKLLKEALVVAKKEDLNPANFNEKEQLPEKKSQRVLFSAFKNFEKAAGGRAELASTFHHCPEASNGFKASQKLLEDRDFNTEKNFSLFVLAKRHKIPLSALVVAFRDAKMAEFSLRSLVQMGQHVDPIIEQTALDAQNHFTECHVCEGKARVRKMNDNGEWAKNEDGDFITQLCYNCRGKGKIFKEHDTTSRTNFLKMTGLLPDKALINQNFNQQANILKGDFVPGDGSFEKLIRAVDSLEVKVEEQPIDVPYSQFEEQDEKKEV